MANQKKQASKQVAIVLADAEKSALALSCLAEAGIEAREIRDDLLTPSVLKRFDTIVTDFEHLDNMYEDTYQKLVYFWNEKTPESLYDAVVGKFFFVVPKGAKPSLLVRIVQASLARSIGTVSVDNLPARGSVIHDMPRFAFNGFEANFVDGTFTYRGKDIYLTKGEIDFVKRFAKNVPHSSGHERQTLYRLRRKFGREFLSAVDAMKLVASYE